MSFFKKLFKQNQPVIIVSGLPRSGTSMMMKMLAAGGIPPLTDQIRAADDDNPHGYYEFERVKQLDKGDTAWVAGAQGSAVKVISQLLRHLPADQEYRVIFMRRHMDEILASQKKMLVHRGEDPNRVSDEELIALFEKHLAQVTQWLDQQPNIKTLYLHYSDVLAAPRPAANQINAFLDGRLDTQAMATSVDPTLYRNRQQLTSA
ncbi:MAG: sulfotransferase family protein [Chloroflexi bacterium]|nr:sulfotransferase domain-containing protein [Ardenticatenaceae bacterium]MBL1129263.1 sulfotransferase family protein [Chloroflexota bacterium]NOG35340.1 sulfotransferase family protein [Chloroflexota bacterium]